MIIRIRQSFIAMVILMALFTSVSSVSAQQMLGSSRKFKRTNPDIKKYEFVRDYISSLSYLKVNEDESKEINELAATETKEIDRIALLRDNLIRNNVNLRIARNYLKKHNKQKENGLILKVVDTFSKMCDDLIALNNQERNLLENLYYTQLKDEMDSFDRSAYERNQERIAAQRKTTSKKLLESSLFVTKVLISPQENYYGEFDRLGITQEERYRLLYKIDEFAEDGFKGELRAGQTFLQGSVVAIREILEDYDFETIDG